MRKTFGILVVLLALGSVPALAGPIAITGSAADPRYVAGTNTTSNLGDEAAICAAFVLGPNCLGGGTLLYKSDFGGGDGGSLAGSYTTSFTGEPNGATITYDGAPAPYATCPSCYLIVKDGSKGNPAQFLFTLNQVGLSPAWDGTSTITLSGFWDGAGVQGAISNVAIWGTPTAVPDGGTTLALMGGAFLALSVLRRKLHA